MQGYTGCIAEFDTGRAGPVTALRFDIDCVGVEETDKEEHLPNKEKFFFFFFFISSQNNDNAYE